jgi:MATE family multidrug resistance protein
MVTLLDGVAVGREIKDEVRAAVGALKTKGVVPGLGVLLVGDARVPMILNLVGFWFVGLPVSAGLGFLLGAGPPGIWWGLAIGIGVVAVLLAHRVRRRFGRELRRLVIDDDDLTP